MRNVFVEKMSRAGEIDQQLRALTILLEGSNSIQSIPHASVKFVFFSDFGEIFQTISIRHIPPLIFFSEHHE